MPSNAVQRSEWRALKFEDLGTSTTQVLEPQLHTHDYWVTLKSSAMSNETRLSSVPWIPYDINPVMVIGPTALNAEPTHVGGCMVDADHDDCRNGRCTVGSNTDLTFTNGGDLLAVRMNIKPRASIFKTPQHMHHSILISAWLPTTISV